MSVIQPTNGKLTAGNIVKYVVGLPYALAPLAYLGYAIYAGISVDILVWVMVLMYSIASAYVIFGEKHVERAFDRATDLAEQDSSE